MSDRGILSSLHAGPRRFGTTSVPFLAPAAGSPFRSTHYSNTPLPAVKISTAGAAGASGDAEYDDYYNDGGGSNSNSVYKYYDVTDVPPIPPCPSPDVSDLGCGEGEEQGGDEWTIVDSMDIEGTCSEDIGAFLMDAFDCEEGTALLLGDDGSAAAAVAAAAV